MQSENYVTILEVIGTSDCWTFYGVYDESKSPRQAIKDYQKESGIKGRIQREFKNSGACYIDGVCQAYQVSVE